MSVSRRRFLKTGALSALAAGCVLGRGLPAFGQDAAGANPALDHAIPFEATRNPVFYYTRATFEPYVGGVFRGVAGGAPVDLRLLRVDGYAPQAGTRIMNTRRRETDSFTLTFRAGRSLSGLSDVHQLEHAALGRFRLLMTRYVNPRGQVFYEAVVNHVV